jgi:copper transport protein
VQHFSRNITIIIMIILSYSLISSLVFPLKETYGHAFVTSSSPSSSQSLASSPPRLDVFFSEPVDLKYSKLKILDENGKQVDTQELHYLNGDQSALSVMLPPLKDGVYTVSTTVLSQTDGHVTENAFVFAVGEAVIPTNISSKISQKSVVYIPEALARFPTLVGQVIIVGGAFSTLWLWRPVKRIEGISFMISEVRKKIDRALVSVFLIGSIILVVSDIAILAFQAQAISAGILDVIATRFGTVVLARTILSIAVFSISIAIFRTNQSTPQILTRGETVGILSLGLSLLLTTSMIGHGAANNQFSSIGIDFAHNLAASLWIGGVLYLGFIFTSKLQVDNSLSHAHKIALISLIIPRFSVLVVMILGFIVFTGPFLLYILDNNLQQVLSSSYGYTLIVKLSLAVVMLAIGSYNQLSIQRKAQTCTSVAVSLSTNGKSRELNSPPDPNFVDGHHKKWTKNDGREILSRFSRSTKVESIIGILLLASVALLVNTGLPKSETQGQPQEQLFGNMTFQQVQDGFKSTYFADNNTKVVLSIVPYVVGSNNFTVSFVDSHNVPVDVTSAKLQYTETEKSIGPISIDLHKVSKGVYSAKGAFGIPGLWNLQIEGIPSKPNTPAISATFSDVRIKPKLDQFQFNITEFNTPNNSSQPLYPIYDKSRNSIWVGDTAINSGQILEYDLATNKYLQHKINGTNIITILAQDSKNNLWFVDPITKLVGVYESVTGENRLFPIPKNVLPSSIAVDPNDNLWITSSTTSQILIFNTKMSNITRTISLENGARPLTIAIDAISGLAWIADERGKLVMVDPANNHSSALYAPSGVNNTLKSPTGLLLDNLGDNIFISQHEGQRVSVFNRITKAFQDYPLLDPKGLPFGMALDKYGNLWVAEHTINKIAVIDPQTGKSKEVNIPNQTPFVQWITSDSDGNIWIAEQRGHALGMITSKVSAVPPPSSITQPLPKESEGISNLLNYSLTIAPAIVIGLVLVALMYVKNTVDYGIAERTVRKYQRTL